MNKDQFQNKYHDYSVKNYMDALSDSLKVNSIAIDFKCIPVKIGESYCLMLEEAASLLNGCGIF